MIEGVVTSTQELQLHPDSRNAHSFCSEISRFTNPGPITELRGSFPNVKAAGSEKAAVLNQCAAILGPMLGFPVDLDAQVVTVHQTDIRDIVRRSQIHSEWRAALRHKIPLARQRMDSARTQALPPIAKGKS